MRPELLTPQGGLEDEQLIADVLELASVKEVPVADVRLWTRLERALATNWPCACTCGRPTISTAFRIFRISCGSIQAPPSTLPGGTRKASKTPQTRADCCYVGQLKKDETGPSHMAVDGPASSSHPHPLGGNA
jgi:hypothetical protein